MSLTRTKFFRVVFCPALSLASLVLLHNSYRPTAASTEYAKPCSDFVTRQVNLENQAIKKMAAAYPAEPSLRVTSKVGVSVVVNKNGKVVSAKAICGHPLLMAASVKAARQWRFRPLKVNRKFTKRVGIIVFDFKQSHNESTL